MAAVGIICEYDPFHRGHERQLRLIRAQAPGAAIVCLMSGCFTQRGAAALFSPAFRAERALRAGADVVLELPAAYAVRDGEHFALGGVSILSDLGFVDRLSFGVESGLESLAPAAALLEKPDAAFDAALRDRLRRGLSIAAAQGAALAERLPGSAPALAQPNNILALCYLRAMLRLNSRLSPLPVLREGSYHAPDLGKDAYPSAKAVRSALLRGENARAEAACGYLPPLAPRCLPDALDRVLLHTLRERTPDQLRQLPYCTEGLENRLAAAARDSVSREELLSAIKTRRYPYTRLNRLCCHALLHITADLLEAYPRPPYVRLLGFRREAEGLLSRFRQSRVPVVAKAADGDRNHPLYRLDMEAYDLWALGAGLPAGLMLRSGVTVIEPSDEQKRRDDL